MRTSPAPRPDRTGHAALRLLAAYRVGCAGLRGGAVPPGVGAAVCDQLPVFFQTDDLGPFEQEHELVANQPDGRVGFLAAALRQEPGGTRYAEPEQRLTGWTRRDR